MKNFVVCLMALLVLTSLPAAAWASEHEDQGSLGEPVPIPAGRPGGAGYTPIEQRADDSGMAMVVVTIFGLPVVIWLIARTIKKARKTTDE